MRNLELVAVLEKKWFRVLHKTYTTCRLFPNSSFSIFRLLFGKSLSNIYNELTLCTTFLINLYFIYFNYHVYINLSKYFFFISDITLLQKLFNKIRLVLVVRNSEYVAVFEKKWYHVLAILYTNFPPFSEFFPFLEYFLEIHYPICILN